MLPLVNHQNFTWRATLKQLTYLQQLPQEPFQPITLPVHLASEMYVSQKKDSSSPHLQPPIPPIFHPLCIVHPTNNLLLVPYWGAQCPMFINAFLAHHIQENYSTFIVKRNYAVPLIYMNQTYSKKLITFPSIYLIHSARAKLWGWV